MEIILEVFAELMNFFSLTLSIFNKILMVLLILNQQLGIQIVRNLGGRLKESSHHAQMDLTSIMSISQRMDSSLPLEMIMD